MSNLINKVLIIGGGFSGMSAAIQLRKQNIETHLVEIDADWQADGAGISIGGATLRAFETLGILEEFLEKGSTQEALELYAPMGKLLATIPNPKLAGSDVPTGGAIMRPLLARIMSQKVIESGTQVRLGYTYSSIDEDARGVTVSFADGSSDRFDLVIAADGIYSKTRELLFPEAPAPEYSGQGVWRAVLPRPATVKNTMMWMAEHLKTGINPMSKDEVYLFLTEDKKEKKHVPSEELVSTLKKLLQTFPDPLVQKMSDRIDESSQVILRPIEGMLAPLPWHKGRVVLIGDTVHATSPHLASGACIGIEDAIVLAEELNTRDSLDEALTAFEERRFDRCRMVVENSGRLGQIEIEGGDKAEHSTIMRESMIALAKPI